MRTRPIKGNRWKFLKDDPGAATFSIVAEVTDELDKKHAQIIAHLLADDLRRKVMIVPPGKREPNPTLVHHGRAHKAGYHVMLAHKDIPLADLYVDRPLARKVAAYLATLHRLPVRLLDNTKLTPLPDHEPVMFDGRDEVGPDYSRNNPVGAALPNPWPPAVGTEWKEFQSQRPCTVKAHDPGGKRVLVVWRSGNAEWIDKGEWPAFRPGRPYRPPAAANPSIPTPLYDALEVSTWFEWDRAHVELRWADGGETIMEWWDDEVGQAIEDGFLDPKQWKRSAIEYAVDVGLLDAAVRDRRIERGKEKARRRVNPTENTGEREATFAAGSPWIVLRMPLEAALQMSAPGQADEAVAYWATRISRPVEATPERVAAELKEYGAWDDGQLADDAENWLRMVWIAAGDIRNDYDEAKQGNPSRREVVRLGARAGALAHARMLAQAVSDWKSGRAYVDNSGNYRLRTQTMHGAGGRRFTGRGQIAPWNKIAREAFAGPDELHRAATGQGLRHVHTLSPVAEGLTERYEKKLRGNPARLVRLKKEANEAAKFRGHTLGRWETMRSGWGSGKFAYAACVKDNCDAYVRVDTHPAPNSIDIGGTAVALNHPHHNETAENPRELSVPEKHQLRIARDSLKYAPEMIGVLGGPTHEEAREIIERLTGKRPNPRASSLLVRVYGNKLGVARAASARGIPAAFVREVMVGSVPMTTIRVGVQFGDAVLRWYHEPKQQRDMFFTGLVYDIAGESAQTNPGDSEVDEISATELELFIENDEPLYRQQHTPILKNLWRKMVKGTYDHEKAVKLWAHLAESGAKKYKKEFGGGGSKWFEMFPVPTRLAVARSMADSGRRQLEGHEFSWQTDKGVAKENPSKERRSAGQRELESAGFTEVYAVKLKWQPSRRIWFEALAPEARGGGGPAAGDAVLMLREGPNRWHAFYKAFEGTGSGHTPTHALGGGLGDVIGDDRELAHYSRLVMSAPDRLSQEYDGLYAAQRQVHEDRQGNPRAAKSPWKPGTYAEAQWSTPDMQAFIREQLGSNVSESDLETYARYLHKTMKIRPLSTARIIVWNAVRGLSAPGTVPWLKNPRRPADLDAAAKTFRMWHDFDPRRVTTMEGPPRTIPATLVKLGEVVSIDYKSDKWQHGKPVRYTHSTKRPRPVLATDPKAQHVYLVGGKMRVTADGLVN